MTAAPKFDELIHAPTRLSIMSLLRASDWAEFRFIRETLGLSDSALSKQLALLEDAGYIEIRKAFVGKWPRTSARLSRAGRAAFEGHVGRLRQIVDSSGLSFDEAPAAALGAPDRSRSRPAPRRPARA